LDRAEPGHRIWFDDGKIGAVVVSVEGPNLVTVEITRAKPDGTWLKPEKGINLADTPVAVDSLTEEDVQNLRTMAPLVNVIGMSFIRSEADVSRLFGVMEEAEREGIGSLGVHQPGVVLKIETRDAFERLPQILLQALRRPPVGIMVARGDLAVEVGYDRLAEIQEEILWIAEAAHVPVIWATQVLDGMARKGIPTRAEVSDTVMSGRAECVMLNKGLYIVEAVRFLDNVLRRMADHQDKKRTLLRKLRVSEQFYEG
jgi:pyruvate kinase